ncbi:MULTISPECIES: hypothetical protein [Streptomyces]|nr:MULTISPECIES: hypothetical protein [Streptomyces]
MQPSADKAGPGRSPSSGPAPTPTPGPAGGSGRWVRPETARSSARLRAEALGEGGTRRAVRLIEETLMR